MKLFTQQDYLRLQSNAYEALLGLSTEEGINASAKEEIYGCIFGRDSAITILKILKVLSTKLPPEKSIDSSKLTTICKHALLTLVSLQGQEVNIESGEQPGKFIHEYRKTNISEIARLYGPRFIYPDGTLRNYDSIDSTPLVLIALYRYWEATQDATFLFTVLPAVEKALVWITSYADLDGDALIEYEFAQDRKFSGSRIQSWTDSEESLKRKDGTLPEYPIAPVEAQGYAWLALKLWENFYSTQQGNYDYAWKLSRKLKAHALRMKKRFNETFLFYDKGLVFPAQALDGRKQQTQTITGNPLLVLWASNGKKDNLECILETEYVQDVVRRSFMDDLFDPEAGIRTMSTRSETFDPSISSYHNGSFWPKLNGMAHEGLEKWDFEEEAYSLKIASLQAFLFFGSPIELYHRDKDKGYSEWMNIANGHRGNKLQAWSAAAFLDLASE